MARRVVVVGGGVAGAVAAMTAARRGATVTCVPGRPGASSLASGAVDARPWDDPERDAPPPSEGARAALKELGGCVLGACRLLATTGVTRPAAGRDASLLDVAPLCGEVLVPLAEQYGWHAETFAQAWSTDVTLRARGVSFRAGGTSILRHTAERAMSDPELAALHDDPERLEWLAGRLREALAATPGCVAVVLPPWLGIERARAADLSARVCVPCGEAMGGPGGPAGLRFERARDRALPAAEVQTVAGWVARVDAGEGGVTVTLEGGTELEADAVVLATGGVLAGGIVYAPAEAMLARAVPSSPRPSFRLGLDAPARLFAGGAPVDVPGSLFGATPESLAWPYSRHPALERVGVRVDAAGRASPCVFAAGDLIADRPRTWLEAVEAGVKAGAGAAG